MNAQCNPVEQALNTDRVHIGRKSKKYEIIDAMMAHEINKEQRGSSPDEVKGYESRVRALVDACHALLHVLGRKTDAKRTYTYDAVSGNQYMMAVFAAALEVSCCDKLR